MRAPGKFIQVKFCTFISFQKSKKIEYMEWLQITSNRYLISFINIFYLFKEFNTQVCQTKSFK